MRKIYLILNCLFVFQIAFSESDFKKNTRFGITINPCISWIGANAKTVKKESPYLGCGIGVEGDYFFSSNYAINGGMTLNFISTALSFDEGKLERNHEYYTLNGNKLTYNLTYVQFPIGLKFLSSDLGKFNISGSLGLNLQFLATATGTISGQVYNETTKQNESFDKLSIDDELSPVNLGMYVGMGVEYYFLGRTALVFGLRYNYGFNNTIETKYKENADYNLNTLNAIVGIIF